MSCVFIGRNFCRTIATLTTAELNFYFKDCVFVPLDFNFRFWCKFVSSLTIEISKNKSPSKITHHIVFTFIVCAVDLKFFFHCTSKCLRPYHTESTSSRLVTEVKQCWAVLGRVSTLVGDHLGIPCVVDFAFQFWIY